MIKALKKLILAASVSVVTLLGSQYASAGILDVPCPLARPLFTIVPTPVIGELLCTKGS